MTISNRNVYTTPSLPVFGAAGSSVADPTFGSRIWRVTDGNTDPDVSNVNASWYTPGAASQHGWNSDSTKFWIQGRGGVFHIMNWDAVNKAVSYNRSVTFNFDACWSTSNPNYLYGVRGANAHSVYRADISSGTTVYTLIYDPDSDFTLANPSYSNACVIGNDCLAFTFGGGYQDGMDHIAWLPLGNIANRKTMNTVTRLGATTTLAAPIVAGDTSLTLAAGAGANFGFILPFYLVLTNGANTETIKVNAKSGDVCSSLNRAQLGTTAQSFAANTTAIQNRLVNHSCQIDNSGRYVLIASSNEAGVAWQVAVWDTTLDIVTPVPFRPGDQGGGGHTSMNWGGLINADVWPGSSWDAAQWIYRSLSDPTGATTHRELITSLNTPLEIYAADHTCWNYSTNGDMQPVTSEFYRVGDGPNEPQASKNTCPWRAWDNEIVSIQTDGQGSTVWRHLHHRTLTYKDTGQGFEFYYSPRVNVSPNGLWMIFTSNWEKTLGSDPYQAGLSRTDVFLAERVFNALPVVTRKWRMRR